MFVLKQRFQMLIAILLILISIHSKSWTVIAENGSCNACSDGAMAGYSRCSLLCLAPFSCIRFDLERCSDDNSLSLKEKALWTISNSMNNPHLEFKFKTFVLRSCIVVKCFSYFRLNFIASSETKSSFIAFKSTFKSEIEKKVLEKSHKTVKRTLNDSSKQEEVSSTHWFSFYSHRKLSYYHLKKIFHFSNLIALHKQPEGAFASMQSKASILFYRLPISTKTCLGESHLIVNWRKWLVCSWCQWNDRLLLWP